VIHIDSMYRTEARNRFSVFLFHGALNNCLELQWLTDFIDVKAMHFVDLPLHGRSVVDHDHSCDLLYNELIGAISEVGITASDKIIAVSMGSLFACYAQKVFGVQDIILVDPFLSVNDDFFLRPALKNLSLSEISPETRKVLNLFFGVRYEEMSGTVTTENRCFKELFRDARGLILSGGLKVPPPVPGFTPSLFNLRELSEISHNFQICEIANTGHGVLSRGNWPLCRSTILDFLYREA
jgi:hypothetical protein